MFTTAEDFNLQPYRLPNLDADESFADYINQEEQDRLKKILGRTLFDAFMNGLYSDVENLTPRVEDGIEQRWKDLRDGVDYIYGGKTYQWDGMVKMLKPYIYSMWITHDAEKYNGSGAVTVPNSENGTTAGPQALIVRAFNEFSLLCGNECRHEDTLYGYLFNSGETFADDIGEDYTSIMDYMSFNFKDPGRMNIFNI
jgi:hypothetical protein